LGFLSQPDSELLYNNCAVLRSLQRLIDSWTEARSPEPEVSLEDGETRV